MSAVHIFKRGTFGRWNTPMWEGATRAFKLIRMLRKQGVTGIRYTEGPLVPYTRKVRFHRPDILSGISMGKWENSLVIDVGEAPKYFRVSY